ncbi:MAG: response regulator NasT [Paraglaciecola sp.]|jgi:response regulator NasT
MSKQKQDTKQELRILLIDEDIERAAGISSALDKSRYKICHIVSPSSSLLKEVDNLQPDIIVIDMESPNRDILESLHTISDYNPKPIVMFSAQEDTEMINLSVNSGVSAYVVGDVDPGRVKPILDAAVARFQVYQQLKDELHDTRSQLESRKSIDLAKRLLMKSKSLTEDQAFHTMRKTAMDAGQKIEDVAKTIISMLRTLETESNILKISTKL